MEELKKRGNFFITPNKFIDYYASHFTPVTICVFFTIQRTWNSKTRKAVISQKNIGKKLGITRESVNRSVQPLIDHSIIRFEKMRTPGGKWDHNVYEIIDENYWIPYISPSDIRSHGYEIKPCDICKINGVINCHTKKTDTKKTKQSLTFKEERTRLAQELTFDKGYSISSKNVIPNKT